MDVAKDADVDVAKDADVDVAKDADVDVAKKGPSPPPVSKHYEVKTKCCVCQKPLECKSAFPQDHEDWASSVKRPMRCVQCWNKHVQQTLMPDLQEKISQQSLKKTKKNAGKKKKKPCRCGSTDHSMTSSLNCPLNKRNLVTDDNESQAPPKKKSKKSATPPKRKSKKSVAPPKKKSKKSVAPPKKKSKKSVAPPKKKSKECKTPPKKSDDPTLFLTQPTTPQNFYQCTTDMGDCVGIGGYFEPPTPDTAGENTTTTATTSPLPTIQRYALGDNVEAKFVGRKKYLGHVIGYQDGKYSVYFIDGAVKHGIREKDISSYDGNYPTRAEMINRDFFDHGDEDFPEGTFRVRQIVDNEFKCIRLTGSGASHEGQLTNFDIGYVIQLYQDQLCDQREKGVGHVLTSRTRGASRV